MSDKGKEDVRCPYCGKSAEFRKSSESIYHGTDYGPIWICEPCQAWCGCHPNTTRPLGRLADKELRLAKMAAHAAFDPHWKTQGFSRATAYKYLADALGIDREECHIMRHRCRLVNTEMKMHRLDSDPTGLIQYGQESWDDQHGWLEEGR